MLDRQPRVAGPEPANTQCDFTVRDHPPLLEIEVIGELDLLTAPELARLIDDHDSRSRVLINLSRCTFADSSALNVLTRAHRAAQSTDRVLVLISPQASVARTLEVSGLDQVLMIEDAPRPVHCPGDSAA